MLGGRVEETKAGVCLEASGKEQRRRGNGGGRVETAQGTGLQAHAEGLCQEEKPLFSKERKRKWVQTQKRSYWQPDVGLPTR